MAFLKNQKGYKMKICDRKSAIESLLKVLFALMLLCANANALEFNELGHKAKSMGGVGVAVRNNPYAIFYNPALSAANTATRIGYGLGVELNYKNVLDVFDYDFDRVKYEDIDKFNKLLEENFLNLKGQAAFAFKIPDVLPYGQLSLGFAYTLWGTANFTGKVEMPTHYQQLVDIINGKAPIYLNMRRIDMMELPLSYAISEFTPIGQISFGAALKFMNVSSYLYREQLTVDYDTDKMFDGVVKNTGASNDSNFGLDLGVVYSPIDFQSLNVALSAKNVNAPKFKFGENGDLKIKPQLRLGLSYELLESLTLAADMDITSNTLLQTGAGEKVQKSQKMGLGLDFDTSFFDIRAGVAKDLRQDNGALLSLGFGFSVLDIGLAVSTKNAEVEGKKYPRYIAVQLGGALSF